MPFRLLELDIKTKHTFHQRAINNGHISNLYGSSREPMAREPDVALFKTAAGSLACRIISTDFLQSITKQQILPERFSKVATGVVFSSHIARLAKLILN